METVQQIFSVANMYLSASADTIKRHLINTEGIVQVTVHLSERNISVEYHPKKISEDEIIEQIKSCGYQSYTDDFSNESLKIPEQSQYIQPPNYRLFFVFSFEMIILGILWILRISPWLSFIFVLYSLYAGKAIFTHAVKELQKHNPSAELLGSIAVIIAVLYGFYLSLSNLLDATLFYISAIAILASSIYKNKYLKYMHRQSLQQMSQLDGYIPRSTSIYNEHQETREETSRLKKNQILIIRPNEIIPIDGVIVEGYASVDESLLIGNNKPVHKSKGDYVFAGAKCTHGLIHVRAERIGEKTTILQFSATAKQTANNPSFESPFKHFSKYLFAYAVITSVILFGGWLVIERSLSNAIAVVIAILSSVAMNGLNISAEKEVLKRAICAAKNHILFCNIDALESAGKVDHIFIEQDGILTDIKPEVADVIPVSLALPDLMHEIAYTLISGHRDRYSKAIARYLKTQKMSAINPYDLTRLQKNDLHKKDLQLYDWKELKQQNINTSAIDHLIRSLRNEGKTILFLIRKQDILGIISLQKKLLPNTVESIHALMNRAELHILTAGSPEEIGYIQKETGISQMIHKNNAAESTDTKTYTHDDIVMYASACNDDIVGISADIHVRFGITENLDFQENDIILTRKNLSDLLHAIEISRSLNRRIQFDQIAIIFYHLFAVILFGFAVPFSVNFPLPAILPCLTSIYAIRFLFCRVKKDLD